MIVSLDRRIKKLEGVLPNRQFMSMVLGVLREMGYEELAARMGVGVPYPAVIRRFAGADPGI